MKTLLLVPAFILSNFLMIRAQQDQHSPKKLYKVWISVQGEPGKIKGALFETRDSSILISGSLQKSDYFKGNYDIEKLNVKDIDAISILRKNASGRGALIGTLSGVGLGILLGLATSNPNAVNGQENAGTKVGASIVFSIFFGATGAVFGAVFGTIRNKMYIHGNQQQFENKMGKLNVRSLTYDPLMAGQRLTTFSHLRETVTDADGNVYHTVALGSMVYMAENLKVTHFRNGKKIPMAKDTASWRKADRAAFCNYKNDSVGVAVYGRLYNGYVVADTSGICPAGWHVPSIDEWTSLVMCLGGKDNAGGYLKESGTLHWGNPNNTMFTENTFALPSGSRDRKGAFMVNGRICQWWAAKENNTEGFQGVLLTNETTAITMTKPDKNAGLSVRCIRDGQ